MAKDVKDAGDAIGNVLGAVAREISHNVSSNGHGGPLGRVGNSNLSGARGLAAGAALAAAAPFAGKAVKKLVVRRAEGALDKGKEAVGEKVKQTGGIPDAAKAAGKKLLPGGGGEDEGQKGAPGVGKGRRMPVQQAVDVGVPLSVAYNQWTQFEEWPQFMHRLDQATQEDDSTVSFKTKIWGMSKEFVAEILEQRPDERIQWEVKEGVTHTGVVTFHELAPRLTRVQVTLDLEPGSLVEKAARGMRHLKRAVRADMGRFKAFVEMREEETGAWRGVIHEGKVVKKRETKKSSSSGGRSRARGSSSTGKSKRSRSRKRSGSSSSSSGSSRKRSSSRR